MRHIFLSPHLDDAVLSCGEYIHQLSRDHQNVLVVTIFTHFPGFPTSIQTYRKYVVASGYLKIKSFNHSRIIEDKNALSAINAKHRHLGFPDGGFRLKPFPTLLQTLLLPLGVGRGYLYPWHTQRDLFSGQPSPYDQPLIHTISALLIKLIRPGDCLYAPIGVGGHVDHIIVNKVAKKLHASYYWLDQPYAHKASVKTVATHLKGYNIAFKIKSGQAKKEAVSQYSSQTPFLYPHGIIMHDEKMYALK